MVSDPLNLSVISHVSQSIKLLIKYS